MLDGRAKLDRDARAHGIALVHIGKCGGSSLSSQLRRNCHEWWAEKYGHGHCPEQRDLRVIPNESEISKQVVAYWHVHRVPVERYTGFIVAVRNPIDRLISTFLTNRHKREWTKDTEASWSEFYRCFPTVDYLAEGTAPERGEDPCAVLGRKVINGTTSGAHSHFFYNYRYYASPIVAHGCPINKTVYVVRTEAIWHDWVNINLLLGGGHFSAPNVHRKDSTLESEEDKEVSRRREKWGRGRESAPTPPSSSSSLMPYNKYNRSISERGTYNLCSLLRFDIAIYKRLLLCAANLGDREKTLEIMAIDVQCGLAFNVSLLQR